MSGVRLPLPPGVLDVRRSSQVDRFVGGLDPALFPAFRALVVSILAGVTPVFPSLLHRGLYYARRDGFALFISVSSDAVVLLNARFVDGESR